MATATTKTERTVTLVLSEAEASWMLLMAQNSLGDKNLEIREISESIHTVLQDALA